MHNNPILRISTKILFAPIILFGLYVQFHGDFGPGGGFQAGVIVASAFILYSLVFGIEAGKKLFPPNVNLILLALGGIVYGGVGIVSGAPVSTIIRECVGVELSARGDDARGGVRARVGVLSVRVSHVGGRRFAGGGGGVPLGGRGARFDIGARDGARRVRRCRCARVRRG